MQASRSQPRGRYDTFTCLRCDFIVAYRPDEMTPRDPDRDD
jgi:hypothetical protein